MEARPNKLIKKASYTKIHKKRGCLKMTVFDHIWTCINYLSYIKIGLKAQTSFSILYYISLSYKLFVFLLYLIFIILRSNDAYYVLIYFRCGVLGFWGLLSPHPVEQVD